MWALLAPNTQTRTSHAGAAVIRIVAGCFIAGFHGWHKLLEGFDHVQTGAAWPLLLDVQALGFPFALASAFAAGFLARFASFAVAVSLAVAACSNLQTGKDNQLALLRAHLLRLHALWCCPVFGRRVAVWTALRATAPSRYRVAVLSAFVAAANPIAAADQPGPLKRIALTESGDVYLSLGGELRERYEYYREPSFGVRGISRDDYLLHRLLLGINLHAGDSIRFYLQLGSHFEAGKQAPRIPTDVDQLDIQQVYMDIAVPLDARLRLTARAGRQELAFGSARLVGVRDGPNVRRSFDGARITLANTAASSSLDAFVVRPVELSEGVFDDEPAQDEAFWGIYGVMPIRALPDGHVDVYYLGLERAEAAFQHGEADEHRHSFGTRVWGQPGAFDYNFEAVVQTGSFGDDRIVAWTIASDTGYTFKSVPLRPRLGLKADIASGDADPRDDRLGTFNALFPKQPYFSEASLLAPANLIDIHPAITLHLTEKCSFTTDVDLFWKHEVDDAIYSPPRRPLIRAGATDSRFT